MINLLKSAGNSFLPLPIYFLFFSSLLTFSLSAGGSGEFSGSYQDDLKVLFHDVMLKMDSGEIEVKEAKNSLAQLRTQKRVDFNDFAGKIDALLDRVSEGKMRAGDAIDEFDEIQISMLKQRELALEKVREQSQFKEGQEVQSKGANSGQESEPNNPEGVSGSSHKKN